MKRTRFCIGSAGLVDTPTEQLILDAKEILNFASLKSYNEAPFVQWAIVSLHNALQAVKSDKAIVENCFEVTHRALRFSYQLSRRDSTFGRNAQWNGLLTHALRHIEYGLKDCKIYWAKGTEENFIEAKTHLKLALIEILLASRYVAKAQAKLTQ